MNVPLAAPRAPLAELWLRWQRARALVALFDLGRQRSHGLRAAKLYAIAVFTGYAIAISFTHGADRRAAIHGFVRAALVSLSWVVGALAALGSAQALAEQPERDALSALAVQRGFHESALLRARAAAATLRVARLVGIPALLSAPALPASGWTALILLGVVQLGLAYLLYSRAIRHVTALEAVLIPVLEPVLNPLWVMLAVGERPSGRSLLGGAIVLGAVTVRAISSIRARRA